MKKNYLPKLLASVASIFAISFLFAQGQNSVAVNRLKPEQINTITTMIEKTDPAPDDATVYVKSKIIHSFTQFFTNADDVKWSFDKGNYYVSFTQNEKLGKALFDRSGALLLSLQFGTEKDLPRDVRTVVKSNYVDFAIGVVTEVEIDHMKAWIVNLSNSNEIVVVDVCDSGIEELHHYTKQL
jgi:hypothetical protein